MFIKLTMLSGESERINFDNVRYYSNNGSNTAITFTDESYFIVKESPEEIDRVLNVREVKPITKSDAFDILDSYESIMSVEVGDYVKCLKTKSKYLTVGKHYRVEKKAFKRPVIRDDRNQFFTVKTNGYFEKQPF